MTHPEVGMCPQNRRLLLMFGGVLLVGGVLSLATGVTYYRGTIHRDSDPRDFWVNVVCLFALGIFLTTGALITP